MNKKPVKKILIVKLRTLGDILTTFPLLRALKELYPQGHITLVTDERYQELVETNPRIDEYWAHPGRSLRERGPVYACCQQCDMIKKIRRNQFDIFIDLYGSLRTALWGYGANIPQRLGFNLRGRKYFYNQRIQAAHRYVVDLNLQFARALGWQGRNNAMEFFVNPADESSAREFLLSQGWDPQRPYVVCSPGAGWPLKCWEPEKFGRVLHTMQIETGCQAVVSGSRGEERLVATCARTAGKHTLRALGLPVRQLAAVIKGSRLFLGNDSGPKYFAESFAVPTVICYGPTDFYNNNPDTPNNRVAYRAVPCRPCHSQTCKLDDRVCLDNLSTDQVLRLALELWNQ